MHLSYFLLKRLAAELDKVLQNAELNECFSSSKQEIYFDFKLTNGKQQAIKIEFAPAAYFFFPEELPKRSKLTLPQFKELVGKKVQSVQVHNLDRSFRITFENNWTLVFKLFGGHSNIILFKGNEVISVFRLSLKKDLEADLSNYKLGDGHIDFISTKTTEEFKKEYRYIPVEVVDKLDAEGYFNTDNQEGLFRDILSKLDSGNYYVLEDGEGVHFSLLNNGGLEYTNIFEALHEFSRLSLKGLRFYSLKKEQVTYLTKEINRLEKNELNLTTRLRHIEEAIPLEEVGHIIMANLHAIKEGDTSVELHDFYRDETIKVKLKKNLSPQKNAEEYYRKAKNQTIETDNLKQRIATTKIELEDTKAKLEEIQSAEDFKQLRQLKVEVKQPQQQEQAELFKKFIIDGYEVLVGKSSANNDLLTMKHSRKDDLWLHAKDVSGSHVVVRQKPGQKFPMPVIEGAAEIAAYFSKGKTNNLCPVIYTPRKFVRKPKGAPVGAVVVEKEEVILVKPGLPLKQ